MAQHVLHFERTSPGSFRQIHDRERMKRRNNAPVTDAEKVLLYIKKEWQRRQISTESLDKIQGVINILNTTEAKNISNKIKKHVQEFVTMMEQAAANNTNNNPVHTNSEQGTLENLLPALDSPQMKESAITWMKDLLHHDETSSRLSDEK